MQKKSFFAPKVSPVSGTPAKPDAGIFPHQLKIMGIEKKNLEEYAVIEMMGHRKVVAMISESDISGSQLLRADVLGSDGVPERTEYIGIGSIYCLTIVSKEVAVAAAKSFSPRPIFAFSIKQLGHGDTFIDGDDY